MNTSPGYSESPQIAIWYFVGATFLFAAPTLWFPDADLWARIALFAAGFLAIVAGGVQLGRQMRQRRDRRGESPHNETPTGRD